MIIHISPASIYISYFFATTKAFGLQLSSKDCYITELVDSVSAVLLAWRVSFTVTKIVVHYLHRALSTAVLTYPTANQESPLLLTVLNRVHELKGKHMHVIFYHRCQHTQQCSEYTLSTKQTYLSGTTCLAPDVIFFLLHQKHSSSHTNQNKTEVQCKLCYALTRDGTASVWHTNHNLGQKKMAVQRKINFIPIKNLTKPK